LTPSFRVTPGPIADIFERMCKRLDEIEFVDALWTRRLDVWTADVPTQEKILNRLGWLHAMEAVTPQLTRARGLADAVRTEGLTDVVLLGMGGSSLAPEVLRQVLGVAPGFPRFRMLDSVDPEAVRSAFDQAKTSLFVLASKSGSTIEPNVMAAEARRRLEASGISDWGSRFVAITDEGTALHKRALADRFREIFVNPSDIGGRYSALSLFGMVPAALMGADVAAILDGAREMEAACRVTDVAANPGCVLGAFMAAATEAGRDKLTLILPEPLASFGLWVEQLVAESTGKEGTGIVPVTDGPPAPLADDRALVVVSLGDRPFRLSSLDAVRESGTCFMELRVPSANAIGAEFLRWEMATATAGLMLGINPFDEPNVQQAKDATRKLLDQFKSAGHLPVRKPHAELEGARLTLSTAAEGMLNEGGAERFLEVIEGGDYFALLVYLPPDREPFESALQGIRTAVGKTRRCATMFGYGPRYLHSTGQLHKGGANNGVFIIVTADVQEDLPIPGEPFSFGVLEMAQALGDFESLQSAGRRALHVHLPRRDVDLLKRVFDRLLKI
jgi:glucose-6-phosphate isomerase/transaldolase/glucose-6-phosphate isomerase